MNLWLNTGGETVADAGSSRSKAPKIAVTNESTRDNKTVALPPKANSDIYQMPERKAEIPPRFHGNAVL